MDDVGLMDTTELQITQPTAGLCTWVRRASVSVSAFDADTYLGDY